MPIIDREALCRMIETSRSLRLVHGGGPELFSRCHIPGSVAFPGTNDALRSLRAEHQIVVYGQDEHCPGSRRLYRVLANHYPQVDWYIAGLRDWTTAGHPAEGSDPPQQPGRRRSKDGRGVT